VYYLYLAAPNIYMLQGKVQSLTKLSILPTLTRLTDSLLIKVATSTVIVMGTLDVLRMILKIGNVLVPYFRFKQN